MKMILIAFISVAFIPLVSFGDSFESWNVAQGNDYVLGIAMASDTDGWAFLMASGLYHWDGREWTYHEGPFSSADGKVSTVGKGFSHVLEFYDSTHIYLYVYPHGLAMYNGTNWVEYEPQPPLAIEDLKVINPNSIWGCGGNNKTCYWNGTEWKIYNLPEDIYADCIAFGSAEEGWAGGTMGAMAHFYDGAWHAYGPITSGWLQNADFANNTYGAMDGPHVSLHYYNSTWDAGGELPNIFTDCYAINDEYFVEVDENTQTIFLFHYDTYFRGYYTAGPPLYCVFATSPHSIWAGGENGYVCHWVWADMQPASLGEIRAQYPPTQTDLSPSSTIPQTKNDCDPLCPQMEFD